MLGIEAIGFISKPNQEANFTEHGYKLTSFESEAEAELFKPL